jgi:hypothetical protein
MVDQRFGLGELLLQSDNSELELPDSLTFIFSWAI